LQADANPEPDSAARSTKKNAHYRESGKASDEMPSDITTSGAVHVPGCCTLSDARSNEQRLISIFREKTGESTRLHKCSADKPGQTTPLYQLLQLPEAANSTARVSLCSGHLNFC